MLRCPAGAGRNAEAMQRLGATEPAPKRLTG